MPLPNPSKGWSSSTSRLLALYSFLFVAWSSILMGVLYFEVSGYLNKLTRHSLLQRQHLFAHMSGKQLDDALIASQAFTAVVGPFHFQAMAGKLGDDLLGGDSVVFDSQYAGHAFTWAAGRDLIVPKNRRCPG